MGVRVRRVPHGAGSVQVTGKRSFTGGPMVPYYPESPDREHAKFVRLMAGRYLRGSVTLKEFRDTMVAACYDLTGNAAEPPVSASPSDAEMTPQ